MAAVTQINDLLERQRLALQRSDGVATRQPAQGAHIPCSMTDSTCNGTDPFAATLTAWRSRPAPTRFSRGCTHVGTAAYHSLQLHGMIATVKHARVLLIVLRACHCTTTSLRKPAYWCSAAGSTQHDLLCCCGVGMTKPRLDSSHLSGAL